MATLVLTAVGTAIGGPIGGLIGSALGQAVDARLLTPGGRRGPRLSDLRVQTSSYGTLIPRLYGRMRVAGTVIWATDLIERRARQSAGKGQPKTTSYRYSASFAVALSSRPISGVERIWAEGNVLRGSDGAFSSPTIFRVHSGGEDQPVDPLIAAAEGPGAAPAYRGIAYALFEDFDLSPYGNRIPSLTFEVVADQAAITLASAADDVLGGLAGAASAPPIGGVVLAAGSRRSAIESLAALLPISRDPAGGWQVSDAAQSPTMLPETAAADGQAMAERSTGAADRLPRALSLAHFDPARDYQTSVQSAPLPGGGGAAATIDLPVMADAAEARALVEREAATARAAQAQISWPGGLAALAVLPGMIVSAQGVRCRVAERRIEGGVAVLALRGVMAAMVPALAADGGRAVTSPDLPTGATVAALFDLPALTAADIDRTRLILAASGTGAGWRRAGVELIAQPGAAPQAIGPVEAAAVFGTVTAGTSDSGTAMLFDRAGWVDVVLARTDMAFTNASDDDMLSGANAALAGEEILQFGLAEPLGNGRWRLSQLLRGRRGTDDAMAAPMAGRAFTLLDDNALLPVGDDLSPAQAGGEVRIAATGAAAPLTLPITSAGRAERPLAPVHLRAFWQADGSLMIRWIRRSRSGYEWRDGVDAPLDAPAEAYQLVIIAGNTSETNACGAAEWTIPPASLAAWRSAGVTGIDVEVRQVGAAALSIPAVRSFPI